MGVIQTSDGFEFETTLSGGTLRCVCRRDGADVEVSLKHPAADDESFRRFVEIIELIARNLWFVHRRQEARAEGREPPGFDE